MASVGWFPTIRAVFRWISRAYQWGDDVCIERRSLVERPLRERLEGIEAKLSEAAAANMQLTGHNAALEAVTERTRAELAAERERTAALDGRVGGLEAENKAYGVRVASLEHNLGEEKAALAWARAGYALLNETKQAVELARDRLQVGYDQQQQRIGELERRLEGYAAGEKELGRTYHEEIGRLTLEVRDLGRQRDARQKAIEMLDFYYRYAICDPVGAITIYLCYGKDGHKGDWDSLLHSLFSSLRLRERDLFSGDQKTNELLEANRQLASIRDAITFEKRLNIRIYEIPDLLRPYNTALPAVDALLDFHRQQSRP